MARETGNESTSKEVISLTPKLLSDPPTKGKIIPIDSSLSSQRPVFLYSHIVLTPELITNIDKKWDACWPINMLRPLVLLDLISYLLFIKKLEGKATNSREGRLKHSGMESYSNKRKDDLSWSSFKDMDAQGMHKLFTKENGIADLIKNYGHTNLSTACL